MIIVDKKYNKISLLLLLVFGLLLGINGYIRLIRIPSIEILSGIISRIELIDILDYNIYNHNGVLIKLHNYPDLICSSNVTLKNDLSIGDEIVVHLRRNSLESIRKKNFNLYGLYAKDNRALIDFNITKRTLKTYGIISIIGGIIIILIAIKNFFNQKDSKIILDVDPKIYQ